MATVILTTIGTGGDFVPFAQIGLALKQRGHRAVILSNCAYESRARSAGLEFAALDDAAAFDQLIEDQVLLDRPAGAIEFFRRNVLSKAIPEFRLIEKYYTPGETLIFSRSTPAIGASLASEKFQIPLVLFHLAPISVEMWSVLEGLNQTFWREQGAELRREVGLPPAAPHPLLSRHVCVWPEWFAPTKPNWPQPLSHLGFIFDHQSAGDIPANIAPLFNQAQKPIIFYTSRGKVMGGFEPKFFETAVNVCRDSNIPGVLICHNPAWIPRSLPDHVVHCSYLPLDHVLPRALALVHHGGIGTIGTALASGVPQIIVAHGGDRPDNAARTKALGACEVYSPEKFTCDAVCDWLKQHAQSASTQAAVQHIAAQWRADEAQRYVAKLVDDLGSLYRVAAPTKTSGPTEPTTASSSSTALADKVKSLTPVQRAALLAKLREKKGPAN